MKVVKTILTLILSGFYIFLLASALMLVSGIASSENLTTDNLVPGMSGFTASGGTSVGTGWGCQPGAYCTSGTSTGGGSYRSTFDLPLTQDELNQGFTLSSKLTVSSHQSNSVLSSCAAGVLQSSDCRDIFKLTVSLLDDGTQVKSFTHQEELDWAGLQNFTFTDVVEANSWGVLTGMLELYGIDAGFSSASAFYGPQFSSPSLTIDYQTAFVQAEVLATVDAAIATETNEIIQAAAAPPAAPPPPPPMAEPVIPLASFDTTMPTSAAPVDLPPVASAAPVDLPPVMTVADIPAPTNTLSSPSASAAPPPPPPPAAPVIAPIAPVSETQQNQESAAEARIEAAVEAPPPEPTVEPAAPEPTVEPAAPEATTEAKTEAAEKPTSKPTSKSTRRKVAVSTTSSVTPVSAPPVSVAAVSVPVTPAMAAQTVVDNIAPSQKYGSAAQTVTLIAMGVIAQNSGLFKGPKIPDAGVQFFSNHTLPDGPSMVDRMTNYQFIGHANALHNALVELDWKR